MGISRWPALSAGDSAWMVANRMEANWTEANWTEANWTEANWMEENRSKPDRSKPDRSKPDRSKLDVEVILLRMSIPQVTEVFAAYTVTSSSECEFPVTNIASFRTIEQVQKDVPTTAASNSLLKQVVIAYLEG